MKSQPSAIAKPQCVWHGEEHNNKVYCKNCKHFILAVYDDYCAYSDYCNAPSGKIIDDPIKGKYLERLCPNVRSKDYPNKNGRCKWYEKKWYKFWVK